MKNKSRQHGFPYIKFIVVILESLWKDQLCNSYKSNSHLVSTILESTSIRGKSSILGTIDNTRFSHDFLFPFCVLVLVQKIIETQEKMSKMRIPK